MTVKATHIEWISRRIQALFGLYFSESRHADLLRILKNASAELHLSNHVEDIAKWLNQETLSEADMSVLIKHLTVTETYFFREKPALELFRHRIIPAIIAQHTRAGSQAPVRIWSAGCSSGEEPYTIAMMLRESIPDIDSMNISILATDINAGALKKAAEGIYTPWSFRETPEHIKKKYFKPREKLFEIDADIRRMVAFSKLNLATDPIPAADNKAAAFDVIFCRNVLMYMNPEVIISIAGKFHKSLANGGWLITSQVELNDIYFAPFQRVLFSDGVFYYKASPEEIQSLPTKVSLLPAGKTPSPQPYAGSLSKVAPAGAKYPAADKSGLRRKASTAAASETLQLSKNGIPAAGHQTAIKLFDDARYEECASICLAAITKNEQPKEYMLLLARAYANLGKLEEAGVWMRKLLDEDSTDAHNYYIHASILIEQDLWDEAGKNLTKALYLQPDHLAAQLSMGQVLKRQGKFQQAQRHFSNLCRDIDKYDDDTLIPSLDGITAGRLREMAGILAGGL